jgi:hypothetical protein
MPAGHCLFKGPGTAEDHLGRSTRGLEVHFNLDVLLGLVMLAA